MACVVAHWAVFEDVGVWWSWCSLAPFKRRAYWMSTVRSSKQASISSPWSCQSVGVSTHKSLQKNSMKLHRVRQASHLCRGSRAKNPIRASASTHTYSGSALCAPRLHPRYIVCLERGLDALTPSRHPASQCRRSVTCRDIRGHGRAII